MAHVETGHNAAQREGEERALGRQVRELTDRLQSVTEDLDALTYSVSHDLRAPLRSIEGFSQALVEEYAAVLDSTGQDYLRRVAAATRRMSGMIDDLLQLSRLGRGHVRCEAVDLTGMARSIAAHLHATGAGRDVTFDVQEGMVVDGDPDLLHVVVENLLANAWKFTLPRQQALIQFGKTVDDGMPVYFVRDNGAGFDMAYADRLFGPFQRMHAASEFEGRGIGLALVQRAVHRHGGRVWTKAATDRGATFYFTLHAQEAHCD